ncbi:MAG: hypothetical protein WC732_08565 [Candidatus Omnitrophota bacterium]
MATFLAPLFAVVLTLVQTMVQATTTVATAIWSGMTNVVNKFTSLGSVVFIIILTSIILVGLFPVLAPRTCMGAIDATYESAIFPMIDAIVTYVLHPLRDFFVNTLFVWWNEMWQHQIIDPFYDRVDESKIVAAAPFTTDKFSRLVDIWFDYVLVDVVFAPANASGLRFGPAQVEIPFLQQIISSLDLFYFDGLAFPPPVFPMGSTWILALKNVTMTLIRLDLFSKSCYYQHLLTWDRTDWLLDGCTLFDTAYCPNIGDHLAGTCAGCHNTTAELLRSTATTFVTGWKRILDSFTTEVMRVAHSFNVEMCDAVSGATCDAAAAANLSVTTCACSGFNCTKLEWWLRPTGMVDAHCWEGETRTIGLPLMGTTACTPLATLCATPPPVATATCAIVDVSSKYAYVFRNRTCANVAAVPGGVAGGVQTMPCTDKTNCELRDWSWWIDRVTDRTAGVIEDFFFAVGETVICEWDYIRSTFATIVLTTDPGCKYGMINDWIGWLQAIIYYNWPVFTPLQCLSYTTNFLLQFKIQEISTGIWTMIQVYREIITSIFDGTILTRSCYFCTAVRQPDRPCAALERKIDTTCTDGVGSIFITGARCSDAGFRSSNPSSTSCSPLPCTSSESDISMCHFFAGASCVDSQYCAPTCVDAMTVTHVGSVTPTCTEYNSGCWAIGSGICLMFEGCDTFDGCSATNCHRYTDRFWAALNGTVYGPSYNLLLWFGVDEPDVRATLAFWNTWFSAMQCLTNNLKAFVGFLVLLADPGCTSVGPTEQIDYFLNTVFGDVIGCLAVWGDFFAAVGSEWLHLRINEYVANLKALLPDLWNLAFMHSNSYYCNIWAELIIIARVDELTPREWIFAGCPGFRGGECDLTWRDAQSTSFISGTGNVLPGMEFGDPYGDIVLSLGVDLCNVTQMAFDAIGIPDWVTIPATNILYAVFRLATDLTINFVRNIMGFFVLFSGDCNSYSVSGQHPLAVTYFLSTDVLLWYINVPINFLIEVVVNIWDIIETAIITLIRQFDLIGWVFDAAEDIAIMSYCFSRNVNISGTLYKTNALHIPNMPECAGTWPDEYYPGLGCALHRCWNYTWQCVIYSDTVSSNANNWVRRTYHWFGDVFANEFVGDVVYGVLYFVNAIVCPFNCWINICSECGFFQKFPCVFACLSPPYLYGCISTHGTDGQIESFLLDAYEYNCPDMCVACADSDHNWECMAECLLSHGKYDMTTHPRTLGIWDEHVVSTTICPNRLSREGVLYARESHTIDPTGYNFYEWTAAKNFEAPFNLESPVNVYGKLRSIMSFGFITDAQAVLPDYAPGYEPDDAGSPWDIYTDTNYWGYGNGWSDNPTWMGRSPKTRWWIYKALRAEEFCASACENSAVYAAASSVDKIEYAAACRAFRTHLGMSTSTGLSDVFFDDCLVASNEASMRHAIWNDYSAFSDKTIWCGGLTLYNTPESETDYRYRSFWNYLSDIECSTKPDGKTLIRRLAFGEPEQAPELARVLWNTYLTPMTRWLYPSIDKFSGGEDGGVWDPPAMPGRAVCDNNDGRGSNRHWKPYFASNTTLNRIASPNGPGYSHAFYNQWWIVTASSSFTPFTHCVFDADGIPVFGAHEVNVPGYVYNYVQSHFYNRSLLSTRAVPKERPTIPSAPSRAELEARLRDARDGGRKRGMLSARAWQVHDEDPAMYKMFEAAYLRTRMHGTHTEPYRDPVRFAATIATQKCPDVVNATGRPDCYCARWLGDCANANTSYGVNGSRPFYERATFRYCARMWDAYETAPTDAARGDALALLCITDASMPLADRAGAVLRSALEPAPNTADVDPTARLLDPSILVPELPGLLVPPGRRFANTLREGTAAVIDAVGSAYTDSWLDRGIRSAVLIRDSGADKTNPTLGLEWAAETLRGLRSAQGPGEARLAASAGPRPPTLWTTAPPTHTHGISYDRMGRSPVGRLADIALTVIENEIDARRSFRAAKPAEPETRASETASASTGASFASTIESVRTSLTALIGGDSERPRRRPDGLTTGAARRIREMTSAIEAGSDYGDPRAGPGFLRWVKFGEPAPPPNRPIVRTDPFVLFGDMANATTDAVADIAERLIANFINETGWFNGTRGRRFAFARPHTGLAAPEAVAFTGADAFFRLFGGWIEDLFADLVEKVDGDAWRQTLTDIGEWLRDIVVCEYPTQVNTTRPYNIFCIPRVPEGLFMSTPLGPYTPAQVGWAPELITVQCINEDYPDRVRYGRYWYMHKNNCKFNDSYTPLRTSCPTSPWCPRDYDPTVVHMDIIDAGLMLVDKAAALAYKILYPALVNPGAGSIDRVHWLINFVLLVFIPRPLAALIMIVAPFQFIATLGEILGWVLGVWYGIEGGVLWPTVLVVIIWYAVTSIYNVAFWCVYAPYFIWGGLRWAYPDLIGWLATGTCAITNTGATWWMPYAEEACTRLSAVADHGNEAAYNQVWGLYFAKTMTITLLMFLFSVGVAIIAVAFVVATGIVVYNIYILVRLELNRARVARTERDARRAHIRIDNVHAGVVSGALGAPPPAATPVPS